MVGVRTKSLLKGVVGVATAYLFAIQLILAAVVATQMAVPGELDAICHNVEAAGSNAPQKPPAQSPDHHTGCPICAFASGVPPLPDASPSLQNQPALEISAITTAWLAISSGRQHEPRSSQGPPATV